MKKILAIIAFVGILFSVQSTAQNMDLTQVCDTFIMKNKERIVATYIRKDQYVYSIKLCDSGKKVRIQVDQVDEVIRVGGVGIYKAWIVFKDKDKRRLKGYISEFRDSSIMIGRSINSLGVPFQPQEVAIKEIKKIKFRRKNTGLLASGTGFIVGLAISTIIFYDQDYGVLVILPGAIACALTGATAGFLHKNVRLDGDIETYTAQKKDLLKYILYPRF